MGKKSRARVAAAGTRKDPGRRVAEGKKADRAEKDKKVGAHAHPEWAPHLNSASEDLTAKLFTMVEVILGVVPVVVIGLFLASKDATSVDKLTEVFSQEPSMVVTFISACLQPFVAYMLYMIYRKYCEGDAGFAAGNLIGLLCSEILLLSRACSLFSPTTGRRAGNAFPSRSRLRRSREAKVFPRPVLRLRVVACLLLKN